MGDVPSTASDPNFWLHHCNIDRLWEVWFAPGDGLRNPADSNVEEERRWLRDTSFTFYDVDEDGEPCLVTFTSEQPLETERLGYIYAKLEGSTLVAMQILERECKSPVAAVALLAPHVWFRIVLPDEARGPGRVRGSNVPPTHQVISTKTRGKVAMTKRIGQLMVLCAVPVGLALGAHLAGAFRASGCRGAGSGAPGEGPGV